LDEVRVLTCSDDPRGARRLWVIHRQEDRMRRLYTKLCLAALTLLFTSPIAFAQLSTAQLSGRVTDESGAVLPGVTVTATQTDTGLSRSDVTDANGSYLIPSLPTGPYRLEVSLTGFRTYVQTGIVLQVA